MIMTNCPNILKAEGRKIKSQNRLPYPLESYFFSFLLLMNFKMISCSDSAIFSLSQFDAVISINWTESKMQRWPWLSCQWEQLMRRDALVFTTVLAWEDRKRICRTKQTIFVFLAATLFNELYCYRPARIYLRI